MPFADRIMQVIVSLQQLEIKATANNIEHLYGSMNALVSLAEELREIDKALVYQPDKKEDHNGTESEQSDTGPA